MKYRSFSDHIVCDQERQVIYKKHKFASMNYVSRYQVDSFSGVDENLVLTH